MKKKVFLLFLSLNIAVMTVLMTSCHRNDEQSQPPPNPFDQMHTNSKTCLICKGQSNHKISCKKCNGTKKLPCKVCRGKRVKKVRCSNCDHGIIKSWWPWSKDKICSRCQGKGYDFEPCSICSGKGKTACDKCHGEGMVDCPKCRPTPQ